LFNAFMIALAERLECVGMVYSGLWTKLVAGGFSHNGGITQMA